jgi:hypothetical protein
MASWWSLVWGTNAREDAELQTCKTPRVAHISIGGVDFDLNAEDGQREFADYQQQHWHNDYPSRPFYDFIYNQ